MQPSDLQIGQAGDGSKRLPCPRHPMHFPLFVRACILTHRLRKSKKREAAARGNIELQYNRSPVQHDMEAPPAYAPAVSAGESRKLPLGRAPGSVSPIGPRNAEEVQVEKLS